ncbi:MAG: CPBP family intramembrane metalloprotease [Prevotellaceae bacterium]|jgi:membrane protease YdiL (CAAX protease family)|nr:CPBP family intramembrane metalloprotease [Prevotellaceae bacterium]
MDNNNLQEFSQKNIFYPNLKQSWILILCFLPVLVISAILGEILKVIKIDDNIINLIQYTVALSILMLIAFTCKNNIGDKPFVHCKSKVSVWVYVFVVPAIIGLGGLIDAIGTIILPEMPQYFKEELREAMNSSLPTILTAVVAAPVLEEIICRGIICEGLIKNISPRAGILWSALIFAVIHMNLWQGLSAFVIGCFLGWIYWKTRSIIPCIFIHFVNNGLALYSYHYYCEKLGYDFEVTAAEIYGLNEISVITIYAAMFLVSLGLLLKIGIKRKIHET